MVPLKKSSRKSCVKNFRVDEVLVGLGLLFGSVDYGTRDKDLWLTSSHKDDSKSWDSFIAHSYFDLTFIILSFVFSVVVDEFNQLRATNKWSMVMVERL